METWRSIKNYEGLYEVSNFGRIRSLDRHIRLVNNKYRILKGKIKKMPKPSKRTGYVCVSLYKEGKCTSFALHRLVAFAFPEICGAYFDGAEVDHIDTVRCNNHADNLRWCTRPENHLNPITHEREKINIKKITEARKGKPAWNKGKLVPSITGERHKLSRPIKQMDKERNVIKIWANTRQAAKFLGMQPTPIYNCLTGRSKTAGGFIWEYA